MTGPYDTALRIAERRLDQVRVAIGTAVDALQQIEAAHIAIEAGMAHERTVAASDPHFTADRYFADARARRATLASDRAATQTRLEALRCRAIACYGAHKAIEIAATRHRDDALRVVENAEQAAIDDTIGARRARTRRSAPRARASAIIALHPGLNPPHLPRADP